MPSSFKSLAELCMKLEATKKRIQIMKVASEYMKTLETDEIEPAVSMLLGRAFPKWSKYTLDISWATLSDVIRRITGIGQDDFGDAFSRTGDVGSSVKLIFEASKVKKQTVLVERALTILELKRVFEEVAQASGCGSKERKERLIEALFSVASPLEAKYLTKILTGDMRTGFHEGLMEQAVSEAFKVPLETVRLASMTLGDIGQVAKLAKTGGTSSLSKTGFKVFRPVSLMLAQMANSVNEALEEHGGKTAFEYKYDGVRIQIHKLGHEVKVFSRRLTEVTTSFPEIVESVKQNVKAKEAILEGEVIAIDSSGSPIPFQHLMRRLRRVHRIEDTAEKIPVKLYLFDILYKDGKTLIWLPYLERRRVLEESVTDIPLAVHIVTDRPEEAERFLSKAVGAGQEGLMVKRLDSSYTPGIRGKRWLKIKPILEPLDLAIVAAEYGYGRRHGWLSDYYLAARDAETGEFYEVGKTFKGLTDDEIIEMTRKLKGMATEEGKWSVKVLPKIVVEVAYNEIQKSPKYKCGMALRFARIIRIREDKSPEEADTIQHVREIFEKQFLKKGRYRFSQDEV